MKKKLILFYTIILCLLSINSYACQGPQSHSQTFLPHLPQSIQNEKIIAKVSIISTELDKIKHINISNVKVLDDIKGIEQGQTLKVISQTHSCAQDWNIKPQEQYFIAGSLDKDGYFVGEWFGDTILTEGHFTKKIR